MVKREPTSLFVNVNIYWPSAIPKEFNDHIDGNVIKSCSGTSNLTKYLIVRVKFSIFSNVFVDTIEDVLFHYQYQKISKLNKLIHVESFTYIINTLVYIVIVLFFQH